MTLPWASTPTNIPAHFEKMEICLFNENMFPDSWIFSFIDQRPDKENDVNRGKNGKEIQVCGGNEISEIIN